ncbi:MAG: TRAP transporter fused permease subunit, partial [Clostridia bacterium]|nr:TRAP transporter fused permease subunit [Clostridia bacterium]
PIMGAAAFLMIDFLGQPYSKIIVYAIIPAILYFAGIYVAVHLEAKKVGLKGIPRSELPSFWKLQRSIYLLIPLVVLVVLVSTNTYTMAFSASVAIVLAIFVGLFEICRTTIKAPAPVEGSKGGVIVKETGFMIFNSLANGGKSCISIIAACAMAGCVAGSITMTGLGSQLIGAVTGLAGNVKFVALFLTMLCCIVLGMGVPTTANFCIMATTCAPILIDPAIGIDPVAAYFFVFYFGIVADITPPVALAAYAGSAIAKSNPMKTALTATRLAIAAFIVPYVFAYSPSLLLVDTTVPEAIQVAITSMIGIFGVATALCGHLYKKVNWFFRLLLAAGGLTLIIPGTLTDIIGIVLVGGVVVYQKLSSKSAQTPKAA